MKCEICHKADAVQAIIREGAGEDDELYVCAACAKAAQEKHQRKRMSITVVGGGGDEEPPPIIGAIMNAFEGLAREMSGSLSNDDGISHVEKKIVHPPEMELAVDNVAPSFLIHDALHLEGLFLIGEIDAVKRAFHALGLKLVGFKADGVQDAGHVYRVFYSGSKDRARRVVDDLLREERNARSRLKEEMPRVMADAICRALAMLRNCRLLSSGELFDLLSPLRLAISQRLVRGISLADLEAMMNAVDLSNAEDSLSQDDRDAVDAERADETNRRFEEVFVNDVL